MDGASYRGEFFYDVMFGNGRYVYPNGDVYEGAWAGHARAGLRKGFSC